jgi:hypothetical protein
VENALIIGEAVGDHTIVELAQPFEAGTLAGSELAKNADIMHSAAPSGAPISTGPNSV